MNKSVKVLIEEHKYITAKIKKLEHNFYPNLDKNNPIDSVNKGVQLTGMRIYEHALITRLENLGIEYNGSNYYEKIDNDGTKTETDS